MERYNIYKFPLPTSGQECYIPVLSSIFYGRKSYETIGDEENCILQTRQRFNNAIKKHKAPTIVPTIFRNHGGRDKFLALDLKKRKLEPKDPPEETFVIFTFADDIYANIIINFSKDYPESKQKPYLLLDKPAKLICLKPEYSPEEAFEEALNSNPHYYADDIQQIKKSPYVDPDHSKWKFKEYSRVEDNNIPFNVDVSVIYPDDIWSTAFVTCYDCGKAAETALCTAVKEVARREIWHNIVQSDIEKKVSDLEKKERERCVIRLPVTNCLHTLCSFREGLIGFTSLTQSGSGKPSLFVRVRLTFYTNEGSQIGHVIHNGPCLNF